MLAKDNLLLQAELVGISQQITTSQLVGISQHVGTSQIGGTGQLVSVMHVVPIE